MEFKKYLGKYATSADVQSAIDSNTLSKPYVAYIENDDVIDYNSIVSIKEIPLTFEIISGGTLYWKRFGEARTVQYSKNGGEWTSITSITGTGVEIPVVAGDKVQFKGDNNLYSWGGDSSASHFSDSGAKYTIKGNIMSLINSTNYATMTSFPGGNFDRYALISMFEGCTGLTNAGGLYLPTFLKEGCYEKMFQYCSNLTTAPTLPATNLVKSCYMYMFRGCSNLNYIKCLATDISATNCTTFWVNSVSGSGTFVTPASTSWTTGTGGIPNNWTRVDA